MKYRLLAILLSLTVLVKVSDAQTVKLRQIGKSNTFFNIIGAFHIKGVLYHVDNTRHYTKQVLIAAYIPG